MGSSTRVCLLHCMSTSCLKLFFFCIPPGVYLFIFLRLVFSFFLVTPLTDVLPLLLCLQCTVLGFVVSFKIERSVLLHFIWLITTCCCPLAFSCHCALPEPTHLRIVETQESTGCLCSTLLISTTSEFYTFVCS
jgi:hypothetical protein